MHESCLCRSESQFWFGVRRDQPAFTSSSSEPLPPADFSGAMAQGAAVGIDLGTTFSVVAVCRKGKVEVLANDDGSRITPSVVAFFQGESYVGQAAEEVAAPATNRVFDAKRLIGRPWSDENIHADKKLWPFEVVEENGTPRIQVKVSNKRREIFAPEEISAMVLKDLKKTAEDALGQTVTKAVITVPAYFNERQRQATKAAGAIAGLEVVGMINEPTAAAIAYGLDNGSSAKKTVFIYDLGGGTFDVSVMVIQGSEFRVVASGGDTHLGGQDFDARLLNHCLQDIKAKRGLDLQNDKQSIRELRKACEFAKRKLSSLSEASVTAFLTRHDWGYNTRITRAFFQDLCADLFQKTIILTEQVLADSKLQRGAIDEVVLVGGSTRIPKVRALLAAFFGGKELRHSVNPDEAVASGAAVRAAVLTGDTQANKLVKLKDVTPLSLGVDIVGGRFSVIIPKNSPLPCKNTKYYFTIEDNQSSITSEVFQGERPLVKDNHSLNKKVTVAVPIKPEGQAGVDITFAIDVDGLLTVTSVEPTTGRSQKVQITQKEAQLSDADIQAMIEKAKRFQREDNDALREVQERLRAQRFF
ncbi:heat shock 70 kDa protein II-like isoform X2 [Thrips palmi]|uniref:Heat shock 70 kDa protein II-like isoform X2 n=2 Tax=Thrips palmi TaxID=161013 RepID=A0A6P8YG39_THRPL|nr:heat shock 70 kDa protein II-like isoform X2 [Thrips palmi]